MKKSGAWILGLFLTLVMGNALAHDFGGPTTPNVAPPPPKEPPCPAGMCCRGGGGTGGGPGFGGSGVGDPVWAYDGSLHMRYVDLQVGNVFPIQIVRSYDSRTELDTALGYGWAFEHDRRLFEYPDGSVIIRSGCGRRDRFVMTGGAYVTPRDGLQGALKELPDGTHEYRYTDGRRDLYDADGRLVAIENKAGQRQELVYDPRGRLPMTGTSSRGVDPNKPMVVAYQPRLIQIRERGANGVLSGYAVNFQYNDTIGRLTKVIANDGRQIEYTHDEFAGATRGNLRTVSGLYDYVQGFSYTDALDAHNVTGIVDGIDAAAVVNIFNSADQVIRQSVGGSTLELAYLSPGSTQVTEIVTNSTGQELQRRVSKRDFDESGYLIKETNPLGHEQRFVYNASKDRIRTELWEKKSDASLVLLKSVDSTFNSQAQKLTESVTLDSGETVVTSWGYDRGRVTSVQIVSSANPTQVFRTENEFSRDSEGVPLNIVSVKRRNDDGSFAVTTYTYCSDAEVAAVDSACPDNQLVKRINGARNDASDFVEFDYYGTTDTSGCSQVADPCQRRGDMRSMRNTLGHSIEYLRYDAVGRATRIRDANGVITEMMYHPRGWLLERAIRGPDDSVSTDDMITRFEYDSRGNLKRQTQPDGDFTEFEYDSRDRLVEMRDISGGTVRYTLDSVGNRLKEEAFDANGVLRRTYSETFDLLDRALTHVGAQSQTTQANYDGAGRQTQSINPLSVRTHKSYDDLDRLVSTVADAASDGIQATVGFSYDAIGNIRQVVDPKGLATNYSYNAWGQLTQLVSPDTGTANFTYDSAGNRRTAIDARGETTAWVYDALNRVTGIGYTDSALSVGFGYDVSPAVCGASESFASGRMGVMTDSSGITKYCYDRFGNLVRKVQTTGGTEFTVRYSYTKANELQALIYPDGTVVDYIRDTQGRVTEIGVTPLNAEREILLTGATYYPFGPSAGWSYGNGRQLVRQMDLDYQPQTIRDSHLGGLDLGFSFGASGTLDRIHTADLTTPARVKIDYDALGRLINFKDGPSNVPIDTYTYDATGNRTAKANAGGTQTYTYPAGNHHLAAVNGVMRSYDAAGNRVAIDGTVREYSYDATGRLGQVKEGGAVKANYQYNARGEQVRRFLGASSTGFLYNESGQLLGQYDAAGAPLHQYIWMDDLPVGVIANGRLHYAQPDHLGTPRAIIDPARQAAVWTWDLRNEAFGEAAPNVDPDGDGTNFIYDLRFPGQRFDGASGLNYNYFRNYSPGEGRYIESDPVGLRGGISSYGYVMGSPLLGIDPLGLACVQHFRPGGEFEGGTKSIPGQEYKYFSHCTYLPAASVPSATDFFPDPFKFRQGKFPFGVPYEIWKLCTDSYYQRTKILRAHIRVTEYYDVCTDDCGRVTIKPPHHRIENTDWRFLYNEDSFWTVYRLQKPNGEKSEWRGPTVVSNW